MIDYSDEEVVVEEVKPKNGYGVLYPSYSHWTVAYALTLDGRLASQTKNSCFRL